MKVTLRNFPILGFLLTLLIVSPLFNAYGEETIEDIKLLVKREGIFFKKFTDVPFDGEVIGGRQKGYIQNGKKEGSWFFYSELGQLRAKGEYKKGKEEGLFIAYYESGSLLSEKYYRNGKLDGVKKMYYMNGKLEMEGTYTNGERSGLWISYWRNGKVKSIGYIKNDQRHGEWNYCYSQNWESTPDWEKWSGIYKNGHKIADIVNPDCMSIPRID